jgi:guanylate kinase
MHSRADEFQYGLAFSTLEEVKATELIPIIAVDVDGALNMNKKSFEANFLFIYPPSFEVLRKRIGETRNETEAEFKTRIHEAIKEIEKANNSVLFTNRLVNDKLDDAVDQF